MKPRREERTRVRVLLIDPFPEEREMYSEYLCAAGFDVVAPANPAAAVRASSQDPPDVIVTRLRLVDPALNGIDVLTRVKRHRATRDVPVVIITTSITRADARAAAAASCDAYLLLPVMPDDLAAEIRRLSRRSPAERQAARANARTQKGARRSRRP